MKQVSFIILLFSLFQQTYAQDEVIANKFVLGGNMNFISQNNTYPYSLIGSVSSVGSIYSAGNSDSKNTSFSIAPYLGKELNAHWLIGLQLDFSVTKYETDQTFFVLVGSPTEVGQSITRRLIRDSNKTGLAFFSRYVFNPSNKLKFYLQPFVAYNLLSEEEMLDDEITQVEKANYLDVGISSGFLYQLNEKIRATLRMGGMNYVVGSLEILDSEIEKDFSSFNASFRPSNISIGFEMTF